MTFIVKPALALDAEERVYDLYVEGRLYMTFESLTLIDAVIEAMKREASGTTEADEVAASILAEMRKG